MSVAKSDLIKELTDNYPNFLKKDLTKLVDIILIEMQDTLKRGERVELRDIFTLDPKLQKEGIRRNPKTGEEIPIKARRVVTFRPGQKLKARVEGYAGTDE